MNNERDFLAIYAFDTNELYHHGILGQKWGVRRYQNPDGSLTDAGKKRYSNLGSLLIEKKNDFHSNVDKWGSGPDKNLLIITGLSGSGKSTLAVSIKDQIPNTDVIHLDVYYDNPIKDKVFRSKGFDDYLKKKVPEYEKIAKNFTKYDEVRFDANKNQKLNKEYWDTMDKVRDAIFDYSRESYRTNRVIAEGVQWLDTSMYPNITEKEKVVKNMPMIIKGTSLGKSTIRAAIRDGMSILDGKRFIDYMKARVEWQKVWNKQVSELKALA